MVHGHHGGHGGHGGGFGGGDGGMSHASAGSFGNFAHSSHHGPHHQPHHPPPHFHRHHVPPIRIPLILPVRTPLIIPVGTPRPQVVAYTAPPPSPTSFRRSRQLCWTVCSIFLVLVLIIGFLAFLAPFDSSSNTWELGLNYSRLLEANSFFVKEIQVKNLGGTVGPVLYTFSKRPSLSYPIDYSLSYGVSVPSNSHQEWAFWLNKGSTVTLTYNVPSSGLIFAILKGREGMDYWLENPNNAESAISWNWVTGSGTILFAVPADDDYYFAFGNVNRRQTMEASLQVDIHSLLYDTTEAESECAVYGSTCEMQLPLLGSTYAVLATPPKAMVEVWQVQIVYKGRWIALFVFIGIIGAGILLVYILRNCTWSRSSDDSEPERTPLVPPAETDTETAPSAPPLENVAKAEDLESSSVDENGTQKDELKKEIPDDQLCAICLDAAKDSFLDPCGHRATCYNCGTRIQNGDAPNCPICRERIRTVRRIYDA